MIAMNFEPLGCSSHFHQIALRLVVEGLSDFVKNGFDDLAAKVDKIVKAFVYRVMALLVLSEKHALETFS